MIITLDYIKRNYPILDYVNEVEMKPYVVMAEDVYVLPLLGSKLFNLVSSTASLTPSETELRDYYVRPVVLQWSIYLYGRDCNFKFTNRGISKQTSDNSTYADLDEVIYKANGQKDIAESYSNRLLKFIKENEIALNISSCEEGPAKTAFNFGGIYVPTDRPYVVNTRKNNL